MAADLLEQSAVLSVPWEYLRFFSMIGSSLVVAMVPPFLPLFFTSWSIFDLFFACSTHILDDIMDNDTWVLCKSKNATPLSKGNQPNILPPR